MDKPFSPACERNRDPILTILSTFFADRRSVLEIGSGTGQHAVHFAAAMPQLSWQCTDRAEHLPGIRSWLREVALSNTPAPLVLDVTSRSWPLGSFDAAFSANTLHIMSWPEVEALFFGLDRVLAGNARLAIYGPFRRGGAHTSESNQRFDAQLRTQNDAMGIRDLEAVDALATRSGFERLEAVAMPANNLCLLWQRRPRSST
ncbi:MAG: DUF938 domain-containing protein [Pseudomarimonas sp.]